jgi:hypothetical protein
MRASRALYEDAREHRLDGQSSLSRGARRQVARWLLFLRSNREYEWPNLTKWPFWILALPNLLTFGAIGRLVWKWHDRHGDPRAWPFIRSADLPGER